MLELRLARVLHYRPGGDMIGAVKSPFVGLVSIRRWDSRPLAWTRRFEADSIKSHVDVDEGPELEEVV